MKWSKSQINQARQIVNDIAEDIDNREPRRQLRQALAIYADLLQQAHNENRKYRDSNLELQLDKLETILLKQRNAELTAALEKVNPSR